MGKNILHRNKWSLNYRHINPFTTHIKANLHLLTIEARKVESRFQIINNLTKNLNNLENEASYPYKLLILL